MRLRRMFRHAPIRALKAVRYARGAANWREIVRASWRREQLTRLQLRCGLVIDAAPASGLLKLYREIWWRDEYRLRSEPLPPGATVIDIGANVGMFALYTAAVARAKRVLCYEPFPASFAILRHNIDQNKAGAITPFQLAIAGARGTRRLYVEAAHACNRLFGSPDMASVPIECVTLADVFEQQKIERCDFLKIDCEGAEFEILLDTPASVLSRTGRIVLEYHDHLTTHSHDELVELLRNAGFRVRLRPGRSSTGYIFAARA